MRALRLQRQFSIGRLADRARRRKVARADAQRAEIILHTAEGKVAGIF
jgi:hypothetical protein